MLWDIELRSPLKQLWNQQLGKKPKGRERRKRKQNKNLQLNSLQTKTFHNIWGKKNPHQTQFKGQDMSLYQVQFIL